jgi:hypothetical protein
MITVAERGDPSLPQDVVIATLASGADVAE